MPRRPGQPAGIAYKNSSAAYGSSSRIPKKSTKGGAKDEISDLSEVDGHERIREGIVDALEEEHEIGSMQISFVSTESHAGFLEEVSSEESAESEEGDFDFASLDDPEEFEQFFIDRTMDADT